MEERASGIIIRTRALTETSLIVHFLSADLGRIALVARGARRPKSPFAGKLDLFYEGDISFSRSRKSELHNLREVALRDVHAALRKDLSRLNAAAYYTVLLEQGTETETPIPEFHQLCRDVLQALDLRAPSAGFVFALELKLLLALGAAPSASVSEGARQLLNAYETLPLTAAHELPLPQPLKVELNNFLRRAIGTALERLPGQRERLLQSLEAAG